MWLCFLGKNMFSELRHDKISSLRKKKKKKSIYLFFLLLPLGFLTHIYFLPKQEFWTQFIFLLSLPFLESMPTATSIILPNTVPTFTMTLLAFLFPTLVLQSLHYLWFPCIPTSGNNKVIQTDYHSTPRQYQPLERNEAKVKEINTYGIGKWHLKRNILKNK